MKKIIATGILLIAALLGYLCLSRSIILLQPRGEIYESRPVFAWYCPSSIYTLLLSQNPDFEPLIYNITTSQSFYITGHDLPAGTYYWKIISPGESTTGKFTIVSVVALNRTSVGLQNSGNTPLNVTVKKPHSSSWTPVGAVILDIREIMPRTNQTRLYEGEEK